MENLTQDITTIRVRQVIPYVDYYDLVKKQIIPNDIFNETVTGKRIPIWVCKNQCYSFFGILMEFIIHKILKCVSDVKGSPFEDIQKRVEKMIETGESVSEKIIDSLAVINSDVDWRKCLREIFDLSSTIYGLEIDWPELKPEFYGKLSILLKRHLESNTCEFGHSWITPLSMVQLQAHPDVVVFDYVDDHDCIFDIKTTHNFTAMRQETVKQLLCYVAVAREKYPKNKISFAGLILPMQQLILTYDLSEWNHRPFLDEINKTLNMLMISPLQRIKNVGCHIGKSRTFYQSITKFYADGKYSTPCQMFLRTPRGGTKCRNSDDEDDCDMPSTRLRYSNDDVEKTREFIEEHKIIYITHAPYVINLSQPFNSRSVEKKEKKSWGLEMLKDELTVTTKLGGKGVVVHVGKATELTEIDAIDIMRESIREVLPYASEECPLILETPAGQKSETLTVIDDMINFYKSFTKNERQKFKLCVDTCHVFESGYMPLEYLEYMEYILGKNTIAVIHYNDSAKDLAGHVDRHAPIGQGCIGLIHLQKVGIWGNQRNIPLIVE